VLYLASTNAGGEAAESTVSGGMAVTADQGGARKGEALFGADDMDDTLTLITEAEICNAEFLDVLFERKALQTRVLLLYEGGNILDAFSGLCGNILQTRRVN